MQRLSSAFVLALVVQVLIVLTRLVLVGSEKVDWLVSAHWSLIAQAVSFVTLGLLAAGSTELARRSAGQQATGAKVASIAFTGAFVLAALGVALDYLQMASENGFEKYKWLYDIEGYVWSGLTLAGIFGLVIAGGGWRRNPALATMAAITIIISRSPPFVSNLVFEALGRKAGSMVLSISWLMALSATVALVAQAELAEPAEDVDACERGLRRAAWSLWLRVISSVLLVALTFMGALAMRRSGMSMVQFAMIAAPVLNAFALASFGYGAFLVARSGVRDMSSPLLYVAGGLSIWAAGAMLVQIPYLYQVLYGDGGDRTRAREMVSALTYGLPLATTASLVALTRAISGFAHRRQLTDLRQLTKARELLYVVLIVVNVGVTQKLLPTAKSSGSFAFIMLLGAVSILVATVMLAKLFALAADTVRQAPSLPTATLRAPD